MKFTNNALQETRGVRISEGMGRVIFWRRMTQKMTQKTATATSIPETHLADAVFK